MASAKERCAWCGTDPSYVAYHDNDWGVPVHDDRLLFEMLVLEGAQAGLSWLTILKKRDNYKKAFHNFDVDEVARYGKRDIDRLLRDTGIVRNRLKIESAVRNAKAVLRIKEEFGSLDAYVWRFVDGRPVVNRFKKLSDIPPQTVRSDVFSKDLKDRGCSFVGSTICYSFMQSVGMVNDHTTSCFRYFELQPAR